MSAGHWGASFWNRRPSFGDRCYACCRSAWMGEIQTPRRIRGRVYSMTMRWEDTVASKCRYAREAEVIWGDWDILWEESEADYQGHATFWAHDPKTGKYCYVHWDYGSCSGCDEWESRELNSADIVKIMRSVEVSLWFNELKDAETWMSMIEATVGWGISGLFGETWYTAGHKLERLHRALGLPPFDWEKWQERRKEK